MAPKVEGNKLLLDGFIYYRSRQTPDRQYWDCTKVRSKQCTARAITNDPGPNAELVVLKGPCEAPHQHPPNIEAVRALEITNALKRKAAENPAEPPSRILRTDLAAVPPEVLSQLPERESLRKAMRRIRRKNLPPNPRTLLELRTIPDQYQRTLTGEKFLLMDSRPDSDSGDESDEEDEEEDTAEVSSRILVFGSRRNIELLCENNTCFVDGAFKASPTLFAQMFAILGVPRRNAVDGEHVPLPFVYALLTGKSQVQYEAVLRAVRDAVQTHRINQCVPQRVLMDFKSAIINAMKQVFPQAEIR